MRERSEVFPNGRLRFGSRLIVLKFSNEEIKERFENKINLEDIPCVVILRAPR